jgi:hypothetical protein
MTDDPTHLSAEPARLRRAPRCGAKTRSGEPCRSPAVSGRPRCRMHGCGRGSGGPRGLRNGNYRHGLRTREAEAELRQARALTREINQQLKRS